MTNCLLQPTTENQDLFSEKDDFCFEKKNMKQNIRFSKKCDLVSYLLTYLRTNRFIEELRS